MAAVLAPPGLGESPAVANAASGAILAVEMGTDPGEVYLAAMLATMDQQLHCLRETQQRLVNVVELACRRALGTRFGRLVLVGSVALCAETPGSDVDVVCFTRDPDSEKPSSMVAPSLRKIHLRKVLEELVGITDGQCITLMAPGYSMEFIEDARVPILRVSWGLPCESLAIDVLIDQRRPLDHVRWFQAVHACPRPSAPPPSVTPLVTVSLRCVKWWLRQRQIPRTKEGGLPTIAWLLLALHTCSMPETRKEASNKGPMAGLATALRAFFNGYCNPGSLHGTLQFDCEAGDFEKLSSEFRPSPTNRDSPWADLVVLDPTQSGEEINLAPSLTPATQLLLIHELQRAAAYLEARAPADSPSTPRKGSVSSEESKATMAETADEKEGIEAQSKQPPQGKGMQRLEDLFEGLPPLKNSLPSMTTESLAALLLQGDPSKGVGSIEVAIIDRIVPRQGWSAPFLHRSDTTSELHARLCEVNEGTGSCQPRRDGVVVLCPCHFVCMLELERNGTDAQRYRLSEGDLERYRSMRHVLSKLRNHQRALGDVINSPQRERKATSRRRGRKTNRKGVA
jgi:hypothetical protein